MNPMRNIVLAKIIQSPDEINKYHLFDLKIYYVLMFFGIFVGSVPFVFAISGVHWDDSYIFFRFAENISNGERWAFNPNEPSSGATSALWTLSLAILALLFEADLPQVSKIFGALLNGAAAAVWTMLMARWTHSPLISVVTGLLIALHPITLLLAVSGMETPLMLFILSLGVASLSRNDFLIDPRTGIIVGLLVITRPEAGVMFFTAAVLTHAYVSVWMEREGGVRRLIPAVVMATTAVFAIVGPYMIFNLLVTGHALPQTGTGKLIGRLPELHGLSYAEFRALGILDRLDLALANLLALFGFQRGGVLAAPGVALLLIMPLAIMPWSPLRRALSRVGAPLAFLWSCTAILLLGLCFLFPIPILRYASPLVPVSTAGAVLVAKAVVGLAFRRPAEWLERSRGGALGMAAVVCIALGILLYETHQRYVAHTWAQHIVGDVAHWLRNNTENNDILALEPIGQIGYYADRKIVDLGGLAEYGIWACLEHGYQADPDCVMNLFDQKGATYLIDRPSSHPLSFHAVVEKHPHRFALVQTFRRGESEMVIYRINPS